MNHLFRRSILAFCVLLALESLFLVGWIHFHPHQDAATTAIVQDCAGIAGEEGQGLAIWAYDQDIYHQLRSVKRETLPASVQSCVSTALQSRCMQQRSRAFPVERRKSRHPF